MNEVKSESQVALVGAAPQGGIARRRLLRAGMAAAPVVLTLSGRSAMAAKGDACAKGLSPMAWNSLAPNGTTCEQTSHTVNSSTLGNSPSAWVGNSSWDLYKEKRFNEIFKAGSTEKLKNILKLTSQVTTAILDADLTAQFSAAYLNVKLISGYALNSEELDALFSFSKLGSQTNLSPAQKSAFLKQTWN